jgi:uncharacterized protein (TIGR03067 family)
MTDERSRRCGAVPAGENPLKTRTFFALLALAGLATLGSSAPAPVYREPPKSKERELIAALQGTWEVEQNVNIMGKGRGGLVVNRFQQRIRIQNTNWGYVNNFNGVETEGVKYQMVLDPKAAPATLDLEQDQNVVFGGLGGVAMVRQAVMKGIVKVEGDTLTFCYCYGHQANAERPKQFLAGNEIMPNGTTVMTMKLKRVK